jgi:hypothetical protein
VIKHSKETKWLGITWDSKLTFTPHICKVTDKALRAVNTMSILGNSTGGMHHTQRCLIYLGGIVPMMTYGVPTWWNYRSTHTKLLSSIQNCALHTILGAFRMTPIYALEIECSIPPVDLGIEFII